MTQFTSLFSGFKHFGQIRHGQKFPIFCSDHFWHCKYSFNIPYPFLTKKHFIMFSSRTILICFLNILQIIKVRWMGKLFQYKIFIIFGFNKSYFWFVKISLLLSYITIKYRFISYMLSYTHKCLSIMKLIAVD